jgi:hypothetical protein
MNRPYAREGFRLSALARQVEPAPIRLAGSNFPDSCLRGSPARLLSCAFGDYSRNRALLDHEIIIPLVPFLARFREESASPRRSWDVNSRSESRVINPTLYRTLGTGNGCEEICNCQSSIVKASPRGAAVLWCLSRCPATRPDST